MSRSGRGYAARLLDAFDTTPWWASVLAGAVCVVLGLILVTRPLSSLLALGIVLGVGAIASGVADLLDADRSSTARTGVVLAVAWIVFGVALLAWLGRSIDLLAPAVALALVVSGVARIVRAVRGDTDERAAAVLFGLAEIVFGVLAWRWPDVTLLIVALLFGIRLLFFGVARIWSGLARAARGDVEPVAPARRRRFPRVVAAAVALVVAVATGALSVQIRAGTPVLDSFYTAPGEIPDAPGVLLRAELFDRGIPNSAVAWRILYTTTRDDGVPALASGLVMVGRNAPAGPRPVIAWAHGTTGFAEPCAPTLLADPLGSGALPAVDRIVDAGWVLVATDYTGLGTAGPHPYLIGQGEGRSVLDAVRAARHLDGVHMSGDTVVWGHSQGGHAALWTGLLAPTYAPDAGVVAVAAMAPAADAVGLTRMLPGITGGSVFGS